MSLMECVKNFKRNANRPSIYNFQYSINIRYRKLVFEKKEIPVHRVYPSYRDSSRALRKVNGGEHIR